MRAPAVHAVGWHSGWGAGLGVLPEDARGAAGRRGVIPLGEPALDHERFRRATRDCLWGVAAVEAMLEDGGACRGAIAGDRTGLIYVTAAAYGPSNRAFIERTSAVSFPYTAPAAVSAETAIEYGITGPVNIFIGGPVTTLRAIWQGAALLASGVCDRMLVLAVELFEECADLYGQTRRPSPDPLVEAAGCLWLEPGRGELRLDRGLARASRNGVRKRLGETMACEPLAAIGLARPLPESGLTVDARGCGERARLMWRDGMDTPAEGAE